MQQFQGLPYSGAAAAVAAVMPKESECGCSPGDNDGVEDIIPTNGAGVFDSENVSSLVGEVTLDYKLDEIKIVEVSTDTLSDGEKKNQCCEEYESGFQDLNAQSLCEQGHELDEIEDISTTEARIFNSGNTSFVVEEAIAVSRFQQIKIAEEVIMDWISDGRKTR